jgi:hypothetical protein
VSEGNPIRVFVSHLFREDDEYLRVFEFLEAAERFFYLNTSKPEEIPQSGGLGAIKDVYIQQIKQAEAIIVLPEHFMDNGELVSYQMDVADANSKPIIVIKPFGGVRDVPPDLERRAKEVIDWNDREIMNALKRQARHEDTAKWDVIDFPGFEQN